MNSFPKVKRCRKDSKKGLIQILDRVFSEYVRLRDANDQGYSICITCWRWLPWKQGHAGHYVTRNYLSTRWNEKNVNFQCFICNCTKGGEQGLHGIAIDKKYGKGTAEELQLISRAHSKIDTVWLEYQIKLYRVKVKNFKREKNLRE